MRDNVEVARRFYTALRNLDPLGIRDTLAPDFTLYIAEGMPGGYGGRHTGPDAAMNEVWGPVCQITDTHQWHQALCPEASSGE